MRFLKADLGRKRVLGSRAARGGGAWPIRLRRTAVVLILLGLAGALLGSVAWSIRWVGRVLLWENDLYRVRSIDIAVEGRLPPENVLEFVSLDQLREGVNLFQINIGAVRENFLRRVPSVSALEIAVRLPDRIEIRAAERIPLALLDTGGDFRDFGVDRHGVVFFAPWREPGLPVVRFVAAEPLRPGVDLSPLLGPALQVLDAVRHPEFSRDIRIRQVSTSPTDYLDCWLDNGTQVWLAWPDMDKGLAVSGTHLNLKLRSLRSVLQDNRDRGRRPLRIDLTLTEDNIPVILN